MKTEPIKTIASTWREKQFLIALSLCSCGENNGTNNTTGTDSNGNIIDDNNTGNNIKDDVKGTVKDAENDIKRGFDNTKDAIDDTLNMDQKNRMYNNR